MTGADPAQTSGPGQFGPDWHVETWGGSFFQAVRVTRQVFAAHTQFQDLRIIETEHFGRALVLDGALQTTERDEFMYHEMLVHVPLLTHPNPKRVLIIGGGDGGSLRRALQHPVDEVVQVELDGGVIAACKEHLPSISDGAFDDPRARVIIGDGMGFAKQADRGTFDVAIIDSTDPLGQAEGLFRSPFYGDVAACLADDGLLAAQSNSPLLMAEELREQIANLRAVFPLVRTYTGIVSAYPGALWSYSIGSKSYDPLVEAGSQARQRLGERRLDTRYLTASLCGAAFALPGFVARIVA